jgi:hypothetical protein
VEPGNIFRRIGGIEVTEEEQALIDSLPYEEVTKIDKDGNTVTVRVY